MVNFPPFVSKVIQFLGREDPLEKDMATHSSVLAEGPGTASSEPLLPS